jgi:cytochrome c-type biogenesis protein CcsB
LLAFRWAASGHAPWSSQYESSIVVALGSLAFQAFLSRQRNYAAVGLLVLPVALAVLAAASLLPGDYRRMGPLPPALQSGWLALHVSCMLLAYGAFAGTFALSLLYLVRSGEWTARTTRLTLGTGGALAGGFFAYVHQEARSGAWAALMSGAGFSEWAPWGSAKAYLACAALAGMAGLAAAHLLERLPARLLEDLPEAGTLDALNARSVSVGFPLLTVGIILGAVWGKAAWGSYWSWDPKETWSLITWLVFALMLHRRSWRGPEGRVTAWLGLSGAAAVAFTYWGVNFLLPGLHAYARP